MIHKYAHFKSRKDRSDFIFREYKEYLLEAKVLDVGCYEAPLREVLGTSKYTGIDIAGKPDFEVNLEEIDKLPFEDDSFDTVLCAEVLEHIDNLHCIYSELFRVAKKFVVVSLPNSWCNARLKIERGCGDFLHYGLPFEKPIDRHKWFFNASHAFYFFKNSCRPKNFALKELCVVEKKRNAFISFIRKLRYSKEKYSNRYCHTAIGIFESVDSYNEL